MSHTLPPDYSTTTQTPPSKTYNALRRIGNLTPVSSIQAEAAVSGGGAWASVFILWTPGEEGDGGNGMEGKEREMDEVFRLEKGKRECVVGMGRLISDGSWYFHILDIVVHPSHRRLGLGDFIIKSLLQSIRERAPEGGKGAYVNLLADPPGVGLYERNGFLDLTREGLEGAERGMVLRMK